MPSPRRFARRSLLLVACPMATRPVWARADEAVVVETVARLAGLPMPAAPTLLAAARVILPPGVEAAAVAPAGARTIAVEAGSVEVLSAGPGAAWLTPRAALPNGAPLEGTTVAAGSALPLPATAVEGIRNPGSAPAVALDVAVLPAGLPMPPPAFVSGAGIEFRLLGSGVVEAPPPLGDLVLRRIELPPRTAIDPELTAGIALLLADGGRLTLEVTRGRVEVSIAAGGIGPAGRARPVEAGGVRSLPASSAAFVPAGAAVLARVDGPTPARALLVSLAPGSAPAASADDAPHRRFGEWDEEGDVRSSS